MDSRGHLHSLDTLTPPPPQEVIAPPYLLKRRLGGPQSRSGRYGEEPKLFALDENRTRAVETDRLSNPGSYNGLLEVSKTTRGHVVKYYTTNRKVAGSISNDVIFKFT
jgi:hypothetical protein